MKSVLVIDDEPGHRLMMRAVLEDAGWQVFEASSGEEGLRCFEENEQYAQVVLVDMKMPGMDGQMTLTRLHERRPGLPVILLTAYGTVGAAVEAMKKGAFDYLTKPADNDELILTLNRAWEYSRLQEENERLRLELSGDDALRALVGKSASMRIVHDFIRQAGPSEATILITGESGTGKELIAESLHACSNRAKKSLIKVNCAALPAQLLESELFGYERGAFTGAVKDKPGRFQLASRGTLFLDEIGEMPLDLQAKLLRAIQDRTIEPLGSVRSVPVDVRILVATNRNLRQAVAEGRFREDLFFRLNVLEIEAPPLRRRLDDLPLLVKHLLDVLSEKNRKKIRGVSPAFLQQLACYSWPGNVRELENVLERSLILSRSDILDLHSLPPQIQYSVEEFSDSDNDARPPARHSRPKQPGFLSAPGANFFDARERTPADSLFPAGQIPASYAGLTSPHESDGNNSVPVESGPQPAIPGQQDSSVPGPDTFSQATSSQVTGAFGDALSPLEEAERQALLQALRLHRGHRERTAEALGISRRTLQYKLKKFGLKRRD